VRPGKVQASNQTHTGQGVAAAMKTSAENTATSSTLSERLATRPVRVPSSVLLRGDREIVIVHGGREYRLRIDPEGRLVLDR